MISGTGSAKPTVLLTGARGMVGQNILEHPLASRLRIISPQRTELDLLSFASIHEFLAETKPDAVIHAAGRVGGIQANINDPVSFLDENLIMGRNLVVASQRAGVRRLINLASTCMYPRDGANPLDEGQILAGPLEPTNEGYALAKIAVTRLCQYILRSGQGFQYKSLIPCNLYGRFDKFDPEVSHLVPAVIRKIHDASIRGLSSVEIWGDGTARREFMYAGDLADAVLRAIDDIENLPDVMNVGVGHDHTVSDYYRETAAVIGFAGNFTYDSSRPVGMKRKLCSIRRQAEWGWSPETSLAHGLQKTYQFFLERHS